MNKPHQRLGAKSNAHVGREFEAAAKNAFENLGFQLSENLKIALGVGDTKKEHAFDLGSMEQKILVECKSHKWTAPGDNVPSAKLTVWNEAMYYFHISPPEFRKIFCILHDFSAKRNESLAEYYLRTYRHLIPLDVEVWELDEEIGEIVQLPSNKQMQTGVARATPVT